MKTQAELRSFAIGIITGIGIFVGCWAFFSWVAGVRLTMTAV